MLTLLDSEVVIVLLEVYCLECLVMWRMYTGVGNSIPQYQTITIPLYKTMRLIQSYYFHKYSIMVCFYLDLVHDNILMY